MTNMHYIGFDIHKKTIAFCEKTVDGTIVEQNTIPSTRNAIKIWASQRTTPWVGAMEATLFTGWIYDSLLPYATELKVGHPATATARKLVAYILSVVQEISVFT